IIPHLLIFPAKLRNIFCNSLAKTPQRTAIGKGHANQNRNSPKRRDMPSACFAANNNVSAH
ncbi:MAG: hypothetical protein SOW13_00670, partial [Sodaliphilus sp.]|nr:hypothetical protein [Sodaliphilus sp.]